MAATAVRCHLPMGHSAANRRPSVFRAEKAKGLEQDSRCVTALSEVLGDERERVVKSLDETSRRLSVPPPSVSFPQVGVALRRYVPGRRSTNG